MIRRGERIIAATAAAALSLAGCTESNKTVQQPKPSVEGTQQPPSAITRCDPEPRDQIRLDRGITAYSLKCGDTAGILFLQKNNSEVVILEVVIAPPPNNGDFEAEIDVPPDGTRAKTTMKDWEFVSGEIYSAPIKPS